MGRERGRESPRAAPPPSELDSGVGVVSAVTHTLSLSLSIDRSANDVLLPTRGSVCPHPVRQAVPKKGKGKGKSKAREGSERDSEGGEGEGRGGDAGRGRGTGSLSTSSVNDFVGVQAREARARLSVRVSRSHGRPVRGGVVLTYVPVRPCGVCVCVCVCPWRVAERR